MTDSSTRRQNANNFSAYSAQTASTLLEDQDEDVQIVIKALGDMKNGGVSGSCAHITTFYH